MKILLVNNYYMPQRETEEDKVHIATSQTELAERFVERGHEVRVVSRKIKRTKSYVKINGVEIFRTFVINIKFLRFLTWFFSATLKIFLLELKKRDDVLLCWDWSTVYPAILSAKIFKIPIVCSVRGRSEAFKGYIYKLFENFALNNCKKIIFSSRWCKNTFENKKGIVLHHGVATKKFNPKIEPRFSFRKITIGFFGRLGKEKKVDTLIESAKILKKGGYDFKILIVGSGEEKHNLIDLARELDAKFIDFVPYSEIPRYYSSCDIVVLPSESEGFSSVILETMAMGKVIVATNVGGAPEIIKNWENGILFEVGKVEQLYQILKRLLDNNKIRKKIGLAAYSFLKKNYNWENMIKKWEKAIWEIYR